MAYPTKRSLIDIGPIQLGISRLNAAAVGFSDFGKTVAHLDDKGGGYLSKALAAHAVAHVKVAMLNEGSNVPGYAVRPYTKGYASRKVGGADHYLSGALFDSIKVLNRRYGDGSKRGYVVGVDQRKKAPRPSATGDPTGDLRRIWVYAAAVEFGGGNISTARPLITLAFADFMSRYGPQTVKGFGSRIVEDAKTNIARAIKSAKKKAATRPHKVNVQKLDAAFESGMKRAGVDAHVKSYWAELYRRGNL